MQIRKKDKRAVSTIIGYILLVSFALIIAGVVYQWLKTYVPKEGVACPDETGIFISEHNFDETAKKLSLTIKNNGQFSIGGANIYYSEDETQEIATNKFSESPQILFSVPDGNPFQNGLEPGEEETRIFNLAGIEKIYAVELIPIRWQKEKNKIQQVICSNAKTKKILSLDIRQLQAENLAQTE